MSTYPQRIDAWLTSDGEIGEALAAEIEVSAARLSRMAELERRLGVAQDALRKACDRIERGGLQRFPADEQFDEWRRIAEERR
jgi:hypothetical protein